MLENRRFLLLFLLIGVGLAGCGQTAEDYKAALQERGLSYDPSSFLESAKTGDREAVELFLKAGMDPNTKNGGGVTALMTSAGAGATDVIQLLLDNGARVNSRDRNGRTALDYASAEPANGAFELLVTFGAIYGRVKHTKGDISHGNNERR